MSINCSDETLQTIRLLHIARTHVYTKKTDGVYMYRPLHKWFLCAMVYLTRLRAGQKNWERFRCFLGVVAVFPLV